MQHAAESVEGKKDVDRWLQIYLKRTNPEHPFRFAEHHVRHRGYCLIPRHWPGGTTWEAFDEETFLKASIESQPSRDALVTELDRLLKTSEDG